jgi:asparagine synthase (glutamine-hydrolysing)
MCGINGIISLTFSANKKSEIVKGMNKSLSHRGPDNEGLWQDDTIALGHRRLSIIDLTASGNQPFFSSDKKYIIIFNGELYNYKELKLQLQTSKQGSIEQPYFFQTNCDTEVMLAAFIRWGSQCLQYFNGMYAFAIYNTETKKTFIARDRLGVKPLYYHYNGEAFIFSSEIRPIINSGIKQFSLNQNVLAEYLMYQTVHAPNTIVKGIKMLMPGHYLEFGNNKAEITQYYNVAKLKVEERSQENLDYPKICSKVNELLSLSVQRRLVADVSFGAFLSGGIDSSAVVGLMSKVSSQKIETFNVSFDESEFSEAKYARIIADKFNTQHHEIKLSPNDFLNDLPEALSAMDHPGGDGPNTYIVSKATRKNGIKMALSGIGGDELFAGYDVFKRMVELQKKSWLNALPLLVRKTGGAFIRAQKKSVSGNKIAELLGQSKIDFEHAYPLNRSVFTLKELESLIKNAKPFSEINNIISQTPQVKGYLLSAVSISEINTYLQNVLLRDTDQMSMAVALEVREPFLDYQLVEFVLRLKDVHKFPHTPKKLLVDSLGDLLPPEIVNRPKMGFTLPWKQWMKHELKSFCEKNIQQFASYTFCNKVAIENLWERFLKNDARVNWGRIWHIVVLNNWLIENNISVEEN